MKTISPRRLWTSACILLLPISAAAAVVTASDPVSFATYSLGTLTPASSVTFSHVVPVQQTPVPGVAGFSDGWVFGVAAPAVVDSWVASFGLGPSLGISGLQMRLVEWTPGGGGAVLQDWSMATPIVVGGQILQTASLGPYAPLFVGTPYALQVQGTAYGLAGGAYSGGLNLAAVASPVPLPAALPLFLAALGLLGLTVRNRT
jgi:hypothetical protein